MTPYPRTRFAPSPTGQLHLGHAFAAWFACQSGGGKMVLRIEDIDPERSRPHYAQAIKDDLAWLGLWQPGHECHLQSESASAHANALAKLRRRDLLYPCFCSRREIQAQIDAIGNAPHGPDGPVYPGTCRTLSPREARRRIENAEPHVWRLNLDHAMKQTGPLAWTDLGAGPQIADPAIFGDVVLARRDEIYSYHLCCVVDDAAQDIALVTRGRDLFPSTHIHRLLQHLLDLPVPQYHHHALVVDEQGHRLAKRSESLSLAALRGQGVTPDQILQMAQVRAVG